MTGKHHGFSGGFGNKNFNDPHYWRWVQMKQRCYNSNKEAFKNYGGRGITVCAAWKHDFVAFRNYLLEILGDCPEGCSMDRIDNDGNYEPGNIRWATRKEQMKNTRRSTRK